MAHLDYRVGKRSAAEGTVGMGKRRHHGLRLPLRFHKWVSYVRSTFGLESDLWLVDGTSTF
jgi:hypothetical protein